MTDNVSKNKKITNLWTTVALLVFVLLLVVSYKLKDILKPNIVTKAELNESCDLRKGPCSSKLPAGGTVTFSINPNEIPLLRPLQIDVKIEDIDVSKVEVDFTGIGMDMGYNRSELNAVSKTQFIGKAILPVCVQSKMDWEAKVLLQTDDGLLMAPFRFFTLK